MKLLSHLNTAPERALYIFYVADPECRTGTEKCPQMGTSLFAEGERADLFFRQQSNARLF